MKTFTAFALLTVLLSVPVHAKNYEIKIACLAAAEDMPNGSGATVYYPDGGTLTHSAGRAGATWYYPNGQTLSHSVGTPGATYYYSNGQIFSYSTGNKGATWYYSDGQTMTHSAPALSPQQMANLACDLIFDGVE